MNPRNLRLFVCVAVVVMCLGPIASVWAQTPAKKAPKAAPSDSISLALRAGDAQARQAVEQIRQANREDPKKNLPVLSRAWGEEMLGAGLNDEAAEIALSGIVDHPDIAPIEGLALLRLRALLVARKGPESLKAAKGYYNLVPIDKTKDAIDLVLWALKVAYPDRPELAYRFKQQQLYAAMAKAPASMPDLGENILASIPPEAATFDPAIQLLVQQRRAVNTLKNLAMLQLLADENEAALRSFQDAYALTTGEKQRPDATANLARAMKARDRGVGPANAWIVSIRPKP